MPVYKSDDGKSWIVQCYYHDEDGKNRHKTKRGFDSQTAAAVWEADFLSAMDGTMSMTFEAFTERYEEDVRPRLKENTWLTKEHIIKTKLIPFFGHMRMNDITSKDVVNWQNKMLGSYDDTGKPFSQTYLRTLNNQASAIFNHAVRHYGLRESPVKATISIGDRKGPEMKFWTRDQYLLFSEAVMDKPKSYYAFEVLYWCGLRVGELLALTEEDIDFEKQLMHITKSYQRIKGEDVITTPKTPKSKRIIAMPDFLVEEMHDYIVSLPDDHNAEDRLFPFSKYYLHHEMRRGCSICGLEPIRIHDLRHSHVSLLIDMGFSALAIADRMGHESVDITYRYAHLFPSQQTEMAKALSAKRTF